MKTISRKVYNIHRRRSLSTGAIARCGWVNLHGEKVLVFEVAGSGWLTADASNWK